MSLSDLASLGSFVSGLAVLISLIYLAIQVQQAEQNQKAQIQQGRAARLVDLQLPPCRFGKRRDLCEGNERRSV